MRKIIIFVLTMFLISMFLISGCVDQFTKTENNSSEDAAVGNVVKEIQEGFEDLNPPYESGGRGNESS